MIELLIECLYCGFSWTESVWNKSHVDSLKCSRCGDLTLKIRDLTKSQIDYYADNSTTKKTRST